MVVTRNISLDGSVSEVFDEMSMNKFMKRKCTVDEYYDAFNSSFGNKGLNERYLIDLFVFGLKPEKRVEMFKPNSVLDAYHLARCQESAIAIMKKDTNISVLHTSCVKDATEVMKEVDEKEFVENGLKLNKIDES
ncbi:hypothetical protein Tco_0867672 [Tanacetum coccineum]